MKYSEVIAKQFDVKEEYVGNIIALLDEGNTIPFIARYRKEAHGTMDDQLIRQIADKLTYLRNLDARREEVRGLITEQGNMTDEISAALDKAATLAEIDDVYRPFRPKRKTRASVAKEKGLEPLAKELLGGQSSNADPLELAAEIGVGEPTLADIVKELAKPGRDPRDELPPPLLRTDVLAMEDLREGMTLKGTVRNVIDFGAFVDIGVHQDGLVHVSQMSDKFVKHPSEVVSVGDVVTVRVLGVDLKKKRISLSMKGVSER